MPCDTWFFWTVRDRWPVRPKLPQPIFASAQPAGLSLPDHPTTRTMTVSAVVRYLVALTMNAWRILHSNSTSRLVAALSRCARTRTGLFSSRFPPDLPTYHSASHTSRYHCPGALFPSSLLHVGGLARLLRTTHSPRRIFFCCCFMKRVALQCLRVSTLPAPTYHLYLFYSASTYAHTTCCTFTSSMTPLRTHQPHHHLPQACRAFCLFLLTPLPFSDSLKPPLPPPSCGRRTDTEGSSSELPLPHISSQSSPTL